jgi:hypothetical protein
LLVAYMMMNKWNAVQFGISFFILYLFYTAYEVISLAKFLKTLKQ